MAAYATITFTRLGLELRSPAANLREDRPLRAEDATRFEAWSQRQRQLARKDHADAARELLALGEEIFAWLDGAERFLTRLVESAPTPLEIELAIGKVDTDAHARAFLNAPWELLAANGEHWALREDIVLVPVRRIGKASPPPAPSPNRLALVFMAAAPRGADNLSYEAEEATILDATKGLGLDLVVEESGTLDLLSAIVAREKPDVVQLSCHGALEPEPALLLEDDLGDPAVTPAKELVRKLAGHPPRMLFLSACETAEAHPVLDSLAPALVRAGVPSVLGWAAPVLDNEASIFAAALHEHLASGEDLARSLAYARLELASSPRLPQRDESPIRSHDWHLARVYLGTVGGGALATAGGPRKHIDRGRALKTFLDAKGQRVPVASEAEFVGRRRPIQTLLRELRAQANDRHAGVLIRGVGRQGKSSLAARVAQRLERTHDVVVLFERYDGAAVISALRERIGRPAIGEWVDRHLPRVEEDPRHLREALAELLEGPCAQLREARERHPAEKPVLLVVDDFEQALEGHAEGLHTVRAELIEPIRALIVAFGSAATDSRLVFTSRFQFTLPSGGRDLADRLLDLPLPGMDEHEARKQAAAKLAVAVGGGDVAPEGLVAVADPERLGAILAAARGNPGLQDLLFSLALEDPATCDRCLHQMEAYRNEGTLPSEEAVREFFEKIAIEAILALLAPAHRELLRAATLFELPVPAEVMEILGGESEIAATRLGLSRLTSLGLVETYEDLHDRHETALAINALIRPLAGSLDADEHRAKASLAAPRLLECWGGAAGGQERGYLEDLELTRLGLAARNGAVVAAAGADALRFLGTRFEYRQAAEWAVAILSLVDEQEIEPSVDLLRTAAERCTQVGDVDRARAFRRRALAASEKGSAPDDIHRLATLLDHARALVQEGRPDEALPLFETVRQTLPEGRERAVTLGEIAGIRARKGDVDGALALHEEILGIFEGLGDKFGRAVTLGEIARIRADKGDVDAALALHEERLAIVEGLGDKRSRAVTLGDIARIRASKGDVDGALALHEEMLAIFEGLGDKRERAVTLGDIARIRAGKGDVDGALALHEEELEVYVELGEKRSRAVTLGDIARIRAGKGDVDGALALHQEMLAIFEGLGDKRSRAVTLGEIARIRAGKGDVDGALALHEEELAVYEGLGDKRSRAVTLGDIARIRAHKGDVDGALALHEERLAVYEGLGDLDGIANTLWSIARIEIEQKKFQEAYERLQRSYEILLKLGRLDGICMVGVDLGQLLAMGGHREEGLAILVRSRDGFVQLGWRAVAQQVQGLLDQIAARGGPSEGR